MSVQPDPSPSSRNSKSDPQIHVYARHSTADRDMFLGSVTLFN